MHPIFQDYLDRLNDLHQEILSLIEGLSPEALDWTPLKETSGDMNSINVLVTHLCGAERYWIGDIALGEDSQRMRDREFVVRELTAEILAEKIHAATAYARYAFEQLDIENLREIKTNLRNGREVSAGWALFHALEHTAIHLGHIQITRQLWEEQK